MINLSCATQKIHSPVPGWRMNHINGNWFIILCVMWVIVSWFFLLLLWQQTEENEWKLRNVGTYLYSGWKHSLWINSTCNLLRWLN